MLSCKWFDKRKDWATIPLRIIIAFILIPGGLNKLSNLSGTAGFFGNLGVPIPIVFAFLVAAIEFFGGIAVLLGLLTRWASGFQGVVMIFAILLAHLDWATFVFSGYEKAALVLLVSIALLFLGGGPISVDQDLRKKIKWV
jgi:putative oxidoreductase